MEGNFSKAIVLPKKVSRCMLTFGCVKSAFLEPPLK